MSEPAAAVEELEAGWGDKRIKIRGSDWLGMINCVALGIALYGGYSHVEAAKEGDKATTLEIKESNNLIRKLVLAQQEANCLNRLTAEQKKRYEEIQFCKQIGEGR